MPDFTETSLDYQPTVTQEARATALRRFNWLVVYLPFTLFTLLWLGIVGLLLYANLALPNETLRQFTSGIADAIMILAIAPLLLICPILPVVIVAIAVQGRRQGYAPLHRMNQFFWKTENVLNRVHQKTESATRKAAQPLIESHARAAYIRTLFTQLAKIVRRS